MTVLSQQLCDRGILTLTLNRPEKLNALNHDSLQALQHAFDEAKENSNVKGILLCGAGKAFCAGADIQRLAECNAQSGYQFARFGQETFRRLETLGKPSVAAIHGYAFGGGLELAMAASVRIAAVGTQFGQPEVKLGVIPGYGGTQRLARLVGKGRALDLCLSGRFITDEVALQWGLITKVVAADAIVEEGTNYLKHILSQGPLAIRSVLECIDYGYNASLEEALHIEALHFANTCSTRDKEEGVSAFLEKRSPQFQGE